MPHIARVLPMLALLALGGCSWGGGGPSESAGPVLAAPTPAPVAEPVNSASRATAETALTDISGYVDAAVLAKLTSRDRTEAVGAQYNALMYGRPGAPRAWAGDKGTTGQVVVGPYVTVNNINCRDFTHTVTLAGSSFSRKGTACRDPNGVWTVT